MNRDEILQDLQDAYQAFPKYRPLFDLMKNSGGEIQNGPEVIWHSSDFGGKDEFLRLEAISNDLVSGELKDKLVPEIGWKKIPGKGGTGERHNNAGRVLLWVARSTRQDTHFRRVAGEIQKNGNQYFKIEPLDNVFMLIRNAIRQLSAGQTQSLTPPLRAFEVKELFALPEENLTRLNKSEPDLIWKATPNGRKWIVNEDHPGAIKK